MIERHDLGFGIYEFHDNYIIGEVGEGESVGIEEISQVVDLAKQKYTGNFGYISNRRKDYSLDLKVWAFSAQLINLKVYAFVVNDRSSPDILKLEMSYLEDSNPPEGTQLKVFTQLEEAVTWVRSTLRA